MWLRSNAVLSTCVCPPDDTCHVITENWALRLQAAACKQPPESFKSPNWAFLKISLFSGKKKIQNEQNMRISDRPIFGIFQLSATADMFSLFGC